MIINKVQNQYTTEPVWDTRLCPNCKAPMSRESYKNSQPIVSDSKSVYNGEAKTPDGMWFGKCENCDSYSVWLNKQLLYPTFKSLQDMPFVLDSKVKNYMLNNKFLPLKIRELFEQASQIYADSPKRAEDLLREAINQILIMLEGPGDNMKNKISSYAARNYSKEEVDKMMEITGNTLDKTGNQSSEGSPDVVKQLFNVFTMLEGMFTQNAKKKTGQA